MNLNLFKRRFAILLVGIAFLLFTPVMAHDIVINYGFVELQTENSTALSEPVLVQDGIEQTEEVFATSNLRYVFELAWYNPSNVGPTTGGTFYHDIVGSDPAGTLVRYAAVTALDPVAKCRILSGAVTISCLIAPLPIGGRARIRFTVEYAPETISFSTTGTNEFGQVYGPSLTFVGVKVNEISMEENVYPNPTAWSAMPTSGIKTVEGNIIRIKTEIKNLSSIVRELKVQFSDVNSEKILNETTYSFEPNQTREDIFFDWDTAGYAWTESGGADSARQIKVGIRAMTGEEINNLTKDILVQPRPIILMRGLGAPTGGSITSLKPFIVSTHSGWAGRVYEAGDGQAPGAIDLGESPPLSASTGQSLDWNTAQLAAYIDRIRKNENAWQVEIIAHSAGSLVVRQYIHSFLPSQPAVPDKPPIRNAFLVGGPNLGSVLADILVFGYIYKQILLNNPIAHGTGWYLQTNYVKNQFNQRVTRSNDVQYVVISVDIDEVVGYMSGLGKLDNGSYIANFARAKFYTIPSCSYDCHSGKILTQSAYQSAIHPNLIDKPGANSVRSFNTVDTEATEMVLSEMDASVVQAVSTNHQQEVIGVYNLTIPGKTTVNSVFFLPAATRMGVAQYIQPGLGYRVLEPAGTERLNRVADIKGLFDNPSFGTPVTGQWKIEFTNTTSAPITVEYIIWVEGTPINFQLTTNNNQGFLTITGRFFNGTTPILAATVSADLIDANGIALNTYTLLDDGLSGDGEPNDGVYAIRVTGLFAGDYSLAASAQKDTNLRVDTSVFTLAQAPKNDAPDQNYFTASTVLLSWSGLSTATNYEIEVDDNSGFNAPLIFTGSVPSSELEVEVNIPGDGFYYWHVRSVDVNGKRSAWSEMETFTVDIP